MRVDTAVYNDRNLLWTLSIAVLTEQDAGETPSTIFGQPEPFGAELRSIKSLCPSQGQASTSAISASVLPFSTLALHSRPTCCSADDDDDALHDESLDAHVGAQAHLRGGCRNSQHDEQALAQARMVHYYQQALLLCLGCHAVLQGVLWQASLVSTCYCSQASYCISLQQACSKVINAQCQSCGKASYAFFHPAAGLLETTHLGGLWQP